jgi:hypothetical protein
LPEPEAVWAGADALAKLLSFCSHEFKSAMVDEVLCEGVLGLASSQPAIAGDDTNPVKAKMLNCLNGKCA